MINIRQVIIIGRMAVNPFGDDETDIDVDELLESHIDVIRTSRIMYLKLIILHPTV